MSCYSSDMETSNECEEMFGSKDTNLEPVIVNLPVYPFHPQAFNKYLVDINKHLKFKSNIWKKAKQVFDIIREQHNCDAVNCTMISLHMRLGDYAHHLQVLFNDTKPLTQHSNYMSNAFNYMSQRYQVSFSN